MTNVNVILGDLAFSGMEVPEKIPFGGDQSLIVHKLIGGQRVIDAMGADDMPLEWSGWFMGQTALDRARYLDNQRTLGQSLLLTWDQLRYQVVIQHFEASYEYPYRIPYRISCVVAANLALPVTTVAPASIDDQMGSDFTTSSGLASLLGDSPLSGLMGTLGGAMSAVSTFANATTTVINSVLQPIAAVQSRVQILLGSVANTTQSVGTLGGIVPNAPASQSALSLGSQVAAFTSTPTLLSLQNTIGRMTTNLGSSAQNSSVQTVAGGSLFAIASAKYGDATSWTGIAKANGLTDPQLVGVQSITVPNAPDTAGGILGH